MDNLDFDKAIREKLEAWEEQPDEALWQGIERRMARHRRAVVFRRVSAGIAAAACLAAGLFLFTDSGVDAVPSSAVAEVVESNISENAEVPAIQDQITSLLSDNQIVADAIPAKSVSKHISNEKDIIEVLASDKTDVQTNESPTEISANQEVITKDNDSSKNPQIPNVGVADKYSDSNYEEPFAKMESNTPSQNRHTSFTISSNLSPQSSQSGFMYKLAPSHASSLAGDNVLSGVEQTSPARYSIPLTFGLQARFNLSQRWSLGVGVNYSYLQTSYDDVLVDKVKYNRVSSQLHYIGVPVTAFFKFVDNRSLSVYAKGGGAIEKGIRHRFVYADKEVSGGIDGVQWSVNLGVGIEYRFLDFLGIYFDPSVVYYFNNKQPQSTRTEHPLNFSLEAGLRFVM